MKMEKANMIEQPEHQTEAAGGVLEVCHWKQWSGECGTYDTDCGSAFTIEEGTPEKNEMRFCCYCGKPLVTSSV